jgi:hypothetical protein
MRNYVSFFVEFTENRQKLRENPSQRKFSRNVLQKETFTKVGYTIFFIFKGIFSLIFQNIFAFFRYYFNWPNFLLFCIVESNILQNTF